MPTIAQERQIYADLFIGRPDGVTWESLQDYLVSATVELGEIAGVGTGQSGVDGVVRRASFVLRNDRALNVLLWPAAGTVLGDRLLPGDDTVDGAADEGEWLSRLLDQTPDYYGDSFSPRDRLSAWNQFDVDGDGTPEYAPLLWPNREVILNVRVVGGRTTAQGEIAAVGDGVTMQFLLDHAPVVNSLTSVEFGMSRRWSDFPGVTWADADFAWNTLFEPANEVSYTLDAETGTITFDTPLAEGVTVVVSYAYWAEDTGWITLFHGLLGDSIRTSGPTVECDARDLAKRLQDAYILTVREYGSEAGTPAEDVIQQIIDDNLGAGEVTLYFPSGTASNPRPIFESPGFIVTPYVVEYMSVWDAIQQVAAQFGWFLGYRWHPNTGRMQLILMEPPRTKDAMTADFYLSWEDDIYTQDLEITDRDIRNVVTVTYRSSATGDRESVTVQDGTSITTYGPRAMQIEEGDASLIDTPEEAQRLAEAALADLKDLTATTQLNLPLLPTLDVFSGIVVTDPRLSSTDDFYGVESVRHTLDFEARQFRTEVVAGGRVVGGHHRWLRMQTRPGANAPPSPERVVGGGRVLPKPTGLVARGIPRGVALDVPVPPVNANRWAATEVHLSATPGFTPSASTRVASGRETHFEIMSGLVAGTTYYLRAFYVDVKGNKSLVSDEVSAVAGKIGTDDIDDRSISPDKTDFFGIPSVPGILAKESPTFTASDFAAFPGLEFVEDRLVLVYRLGTVHVGDKGDLRLKTRLVSGGGWSAESIIVVDPTYDLRDPNLLLLSNGNLLMTYFKYDHNARVEKGVFCRLSTDRGATWGDEIVIEAANSATRGKPIQLANGRILVPIYRLVGGRYDAIVYYSDNYGASWAQLSTVADGSADGRDYTEMALLETDSWILAVIREDNGNNLYWTVSTTGGLTWQSVQLLFHGHAPALIDLEDGRIMLGYSRITEPQRYSYFRLSEDHGASWGQEYVFDDSANGGYLAFTKIVHDGVTWFAGAFYVDAGQTAPGSPPANIKVASFYTKSSMTPKNGAVFRRFHRLGTNRRTRRRETEWTTAAVNTWVKTDYEIEFDVEEPCWVFMACYAAAKHSTADCHIYIALHDANQPPADDTILLKGGGRLVNTNLTGKFVMVGSSAIIPVQPGQQKIALWVYQDTPGTLTLSRQQADTFIQFVEL